VSDHLTPLSFLRRARFFRVIILCSVAAAATIPTVSLSSRAPKYLDGPTYLFPATGFGGYQWEGRVHYLEAQWRVPKVSATSPVGAAATWIGAQNTTGNDFIQIGVEEIAENKGQITYRAFWSDTTVKFAPQFMGVVSPGELLFATMVRDSNGWLVSLRNTSGGFDVYKEISYEAGARFTIAEWIQENPASTSLSSRDVPYPIMTNVEFQNLQVNGKSPQLNLNDGLVLMASTGEIRVPTAIHNDAFTFTAPRGAQDQYLEDARTLDAGGSRFDAEAVTWQTTPLNVRITDVNDAINVIQVSKRTLQAQTWPSSTQALISKLVQMIEREISGLRAWSKAGLRLNTPAFLAYVSVARSEEKTADLVRASLKLPPLP
jgi:Peptidase A4 family